MPFGLETVHCDSDVVIETNQVKGSSILFITPQKDLPVVMVDDLLAMNNLHGYSCFYDEIIGHYMIFLPKSIDILSAAERISIEMEEKGLKVKRVHLNQKHQSFVLA